MKRQKNVVKGRHNALALSQPPLGAAEAWESSKQFAVSGIKDGLENMFDGVSYFRQLRAIKRLSNGGEKISQAETRRTRKNTFRLIAYPAVGAAAVSLYGAAESMLGDNAKELNTGHIITTGASLAISGMLMATGRRLKKAVGPHANLELQKEVAEFRLHARLDAYSSAIALAGSGLHAAGLGVVEQLASAGFASYQAKQFWPSERNLQRGLQKKQEASAHGHGHHHGHGHDEHDHAHIHPSEMWEASRRSARKAVALGRTALGKMLPSKSAEQHPPRRRWRTAVAAGVAALALATGVGSDSAEQLKAHPPDPGVSQPATPKAPPEPRPQEIPQANFSLFAEQCVSVESGESLWDVVESRLQTATGGQPITALTNAATIFTAHENRAEMPAPNRMEADDCVVVPSDAALLEMHQATLLPQSPLAHLFVKLNQFVSWEDAMNDHAVHQQFSAQLATSVAE